MTWLAAAVAVVALLGVISPGLTAEADDGATVRPIEDFLDQQVPYPWGSGVDWVSEDKDGNYEYLARLDFTGVINKYFLEDQDHTPGGPGYLGSLGTTFTGKVTETVQNDGRTLVHVRLHGKDVYCLVALYAGRRTFAPWNRMWGQPAAAVKYPASGITMDDLDTVDIHFDLKFLTNDAPGSDLPVIDELLFSPEEGQEVLQLIIQAQGKGRLRSNFGVEDGTPGQLSMTMKGIWNAAFESDATDYKRDPWPIGRIDLRPVGN